jgi:hypothetical protein
VSCSIGCQDAFNRYTETINSRIHLRNEIGLFLDLQADGKLPASSPVKSRHRKILLKAHQEWLGIIQSLMPEDYYLQQTRRAEISYRQWLLQRMYEAFRTYGPKGFRKEAIFCTIAIILFDLVIEHPKPHKGIADLAEALRKRIERARP